MCVCCLSDEEIRNSNDNTRSTRWVQTHMIENMVDAGAVHDAIVHHRMKEIEAKIEASVGVRNKIEMVAVPKSIHS